MFPSFSSKDINALSEAYASVYESSHLETDTKRGAGNKAKRRDASLKNEEVFDVILSHLLSEGYAETLEEAEWMMANVIDEEAIEIILGEEQLDEISQKTATNAYASSKTGEFEGADSDRDIKRTDNLKKHIVRKFGKEAGEHADKAAESQTFGRKDASGRRKQTAKPRIEKSDYRTTQDGKMHKQDQRELKTELRIKRDRRLRAEEYMDEAQAARENPEKYEREENKKYEKVRGEKRPMPPRGHKDREAFEKWYASQRG